MPEKAQIRRSLKPRQSSLNGSLSKTENNASGTERGFLTGAAITGTPVAMPERKAHLRRVSPATLERVECVANLRLQGIAAALGKLARTHMEPDLALIVLDSLGLTIADLEAGGADAYDLEAIKTTKAAA